MTQLDDLTRPGRRLPRLGRAVRGRRSRRRHPPLVSVIILLFVLAMSLFASMIAPDSPLKINLSGALVPPFYAQGGSFAHVLGTDNLGRDILSRIVYGARDTLLLSVIVLLVGGIVGVILGLLSGYYGRAIDGLIQRLVEAVLSLPTIMVALAFSYVLGQSTHSIVIVLSPFIAAQFARMVRGDVLGVKSLGYVDLARVAGGSPLRIMARHILPNVAGTIIVVSTLVAGQLILLEATLSFLGVGVPPPTPEWGLMVSEGQNYINNGYWLSLFPGLAIALTVLAFNLLGDWLRDVLDPKTQPSDAGLR